MALSPSLAVLNIVIFVPVSLTPKSLLRLSAGSVNDHTIHPLFQVRNLAVIRISPLLFTPSLLPSSADFIFLNKDLLNTPPFIFAASVLNP